MGTGNDSDRNLDGMEPLPVATLRNREQGSVQPDPAARALSRIIAREPRLALAALATAKKAS
jgi:putative transcriptional regulator